MPSLAQLQKYTNVIQQYFHQSHHHLGYDVVLICNDIFGDFIQDIEFYQEYAKTADNVKFILFNIPGQAYTLFDEHAIYNNDYNASMIDLLLEELTTNKAFNPSVDTLKFVGIGFGANIFLYFSNF